MKYMAIAFALAVANFIYQSVFADTPKYSDALERSYFQAAALFVVWILEAY